MDPIPLDTPPTSAVESVTAESLLPDMPVASTAQPGPGSGAVSSGSAWDFPWLDARKRPFDPTLHECTLDGKPVLSIDGLDSEALARVKPVLRTGGKLLKGRTAPLKPGAYIPPEAEAPPVIDGQGEGVPVAEGVAPAPGASDAELVAAAETLTAVQLLLMRAALGEKVGKRDDHQTALIESWRKVMQHYHMGALHPVVGLGIVTGAIVLEGMKEAETQSRLQRFGVWLKVKAGGWWLWLTKRKPKQAAPVAEDAGAADSA